MPESRIDIVSLQDNPFTIYVYFRSLIAFLLRNSVLNQNEWPFFSPILDRSLRWLVGSANCTSSNDD